MKKGLITITLAALLVGCGPVNYTIDISDMPEEIKQANEEYLAEYLEKYNAETDIEEKGRIAEEVGFRYMNLGQYDTAIEYYEEVLENYDPTHYVALNNISVMHEEAGALKKAIRYQKKLYDAYSEKQSVVNRLVDLYLKDGKESMAESIIYEYDKNYNETGEFDEYVAAVKDLINKHRERSGQ